LYTARASPIPLKISGNPCQRLIHGTKTGENTAAAILYTFRRLLSPACRPAATYRFLTQHRTTWRAAHQPEIAAISMA